jgi:hypothetical protein
MQSSDSHSELRPGGGQEKGGEPGGYHELAAEEPANRRVAVAFDASTLAI